MKDLTSLWRELAVETAGWCGTSAVLDIKTVEDRVKMQGESFFTITLPSFCKDFERGLEAGVLDSTLMTSFRRRRGLPMFLGGYLSQVFDPSGVLLEEPSVDCIRAVRELTLVFGKIHRQCSDARIGDAMRQFVEVEKELVAFDTSSLEEILPLFRQASTLLWADVFSHVENSLLDRHRLWQRWVGVFNRSRREAIPQFSGVDNHVARASSPDPLDVILGIGDEGFEERGIFAPHLGVKSEGFQLGQREIVDPASVFTLVPRHGPGATADRLRGNAKYSVSQWPRRLESVFPYGDYALPQLASEDQLDRVQFLESGAEVSVKLTPVPKTDSKPRIIAIEPTAMQYLQQGLSFQVVYRLENAVKFPPPVGGKEFDLGRHFVGFADQERNRVLARQGSLDGSLGTLDLSEASDRVLNSHVLLLMERFPRLSEGVQACRSTHANVPGHGIIPLAKFASMGSALCFPVEAMVFTTIIFAAIAYECRTPVNRRLIMSMRGKVRVYGDDIIVPVEYVPRVIQFLEAFGLLVNRGKSYWNGKFRESCGGDFYDGEWVTPVRLRKELPQSLADVEGIVGLVAFRNLLYWNGYWKTAGALDDHLQTLLKGRWKIVESTSSGLGRESVLPYQAEWLDPKLHSPRIAGAIVRHDTPDSKTSGEGALMKFLVKRGILPSLDPNHLERQGRPVASRIKLQGIRPF
nr:MAG: hypothetical protein 3 [Leviviridae sp.]